MKWMVYALFACMYLLVTLFGLGPVLFADGTPGERMLTLLAVLLLYAGITFWLHRIYKRLRKG